MSYTRQPGRSYRNLTNSDKLSAVKLWREGRDTFDLAAMFDVPEWQIYNELPKWRAALNA